MRWERNTIRNTRNSENHQGADVAADLRPLFQGMENEQAEITEGLNRFETEMRYEYVPGVAEFMQSLRAHGVKIAIVTSSNEKKWPMYMRHILN